MYHRTHRYQARRWSAEDGYGSGVLDPVVDQVQVAHGEIAQRAEPFG
jgi:hypothetical protein